MIAAITAGGQVDGIFAETIGTSFKALAPWGDGRLIDPAINAAQECGATRIFIIGPPKIALEYSAKVAGVAQATSNGSANLETALRLADPKQPFLLLTSDLPFITVTGLQDFLDRVGDADVAMPITSAQRFMQQYPLAKKTFTRLAHERMTSGSVFYFRNGEKANQAIQISCRLFEARKSLSAMARLLPWPLLLRFCTGTLAIEHIEAYAQTRFGLRARVVRDTAPELSYDIDALADYLYAKNVRP